MNRSKYSFTVKDASEFDYKRILNENPGAEAILIVTQTNAALALSCDFLRKFAFGDAVRILNERLCPNWGHESIQAHNELGQIALIHSSRAICDPYRAEALNKNDIAIVVQEIAEAREWLAKVARKVSVSQV